MALVIDNISKTFGEFRAIEDVSFTVEQGRMFGFLGTNGAGKTTTMRMVLDILRPDSGSITWNGIPNVDIPRDDFGYLPEERGMYQKNEVLDQLVYFARLRGATRKDAVRSANEWVDAFELGEFKKKKLETLSKGNQQKIQIAQSFLNDPDILILDEPFSGLDPVNAQIFKDAVQRFVSEGRLVIFSSHQMGYVEEICDDVTLIHHGDILLSGSLDAIKREEGRDKLFLSALEPADAWLPALLQAFPGMTAQRTEDGAILDTGGQPLQGALLAYLSGQPVTIRSFGLYEPSLTAIFIRKAGDEHAGL